MKNIFSLKTSAKKKPFRLEEQIILASSDRYNDPYTCKVFARKIRDRYVVSVDLRLDPVCPRCWNNNWIYRDEETCREKFHIMADVITDIRDLIETEGLKNYVFQYMIKHALSGIGGDVENIYETSNPNARQVTDESTRGNIIKNIPYIPFRSQDGPDKLNEVFTATGNAPNPVPPDGIKGQLPPWQHQRKKDIIVTPFQEAAGISPDMFKGAAAEKRIKMAAEQDKIKEFVQKVKDGAKDAKEYGKKLALRHYMEMTGSDEAEADAFYHGVKAAATQAKIVLNVSATNLIIFMASNEYKPVFETPDLLAKFNHFAGKREQAERAMGCFGLAPTYASVTLKAEGDRNYGKCALRLEDIEDVVLLCGDSFRFRNPTRPDYLEDPGLALYPFSAIEDCKAVSIIMAMNKSDLAAGPATALANIIGAEKEYGKCEALIFRPLTPKNVSEIVAISPDAAKTFRKIMMRIGKLMPVVCSPEPAAVNPIEAREFQDEPMVKSSEQKHFCLEDRVATKRTAQLPRLMGTIVGIDNGQITVEWDGSGERSIFDMAEALSRLMPAPVDAACKKGMVIYSLPGMDDESVLVLSAVGVDPVSLHALASHHKPSSLESRGYLEKMISSMGALGLHGNIIRGFIPSDKDEAFTPHEWVEAKLSNGARLIVDIDAQRLFIKAGDPEDYIVPDLQPKIEIE